MIRSFRHRGLARFYERGDDRGVPPPFLAKLSRMLARLDVVQSAHEMDLPGWRLHPLKGKRAGCWSIWVSANWRLVFRIEGGDVWDVDLLDYH